MRAFRCDCGQPLFFANSVCQSCGREVGYSPEREQMLTFNEPTGPVNSTAAGETDDVGYRSCSNRINHNVCNWLLTEKDDGDLCVACRLNRTIPDIERSGNREMWAKLEAAKRRLVYTLLSLRLPVLNLSEDPEHGLAFDFVEDSGNNPNVAEQQVATGHSNGVITINLAEADPVERLRVRELMNEPYRTLLGHMRHESGHYYWDRLIAGGPELSVFREHFDDERLDYDNALHTHYEQGPTPDWGQSYISAYASSHPWEDWAETWAHYLLMIDTLETAECFRLLPDGVNADVDGRGDFGDRVIEWLELAVRLNELNRSTGQEDSYPFVVPPRVVDKLCFIDRLVRDRTQV
jgi:hypothetical protein